MPVTQCGQRLLKKYLYLAAGVARQWDPEFAAYCARRNARGDHHNRIMIAMARTMALRGYSLMKRREKARQASADTDGVVTYVLRDPEGGTTVDQKQARALVLEKYTRAAANPERHKRENARRAKAEGTGPAKRERPSEDVTGKHAVPIPQTPLPPEMSRRMHEQVTHVGWSSIGTVLKRFLANMPVENPVDSKRKIRGKDCYHVQKIT